jgi:hypothetical protein
MTISKIKPKLTENTYTSNLDEINKDTADNKLDKDTNTKNPKASNLSKKTKTQRYALYEVTINLKTGSMTRRCLGIFTAQVSLTK